MFRHAIDAVGGLRELEAAVGVTLIERTRRVVRFTALGEAIAAKTRRVLREAEELGDLAGAEAPPGDAAMAPDAIWRAPRSAPTRSRRVRQGARSRCFVGAAARVGATSGCSPRCWRRCADPRKRNLALGSTVIPAASRTTLPLVRLRRET